MRFLVMKVFGQDLELLNLETRQLENYRNVDGLVVVEGKTIVELVNGRLIIVSG